MIKVLVVPQNVVQKTVVAQLDRAPEAACTAFTFDAQAIKQGVKKGKKVVVIGPGTGADVHVSLDNLSSIGITIQQVMQSMSAPRLLVIEGFSALTIRLPTEVVRRFVLFLAGRLRASGVDAVFVVAKEGGASTVLPVLMQAADEVISGKGQ